MLVSSGAGTSFATLVDLSGRTRKQHAPVHYLTLMKRIMRMMILKMKMMIMKMILFTTTE